MKVKVTQKQRMFFVNPPKPKPPPSKEEIAERSRLIAEWLQKNKIRKLLPAHAHFY